MITLAAPRDQDVLASLRDHDPVVQRYRAFFAYLDWTVIAAPFGQVCHHLAAQGLIEEVQVALDDGWVRGFLLVTHRHSLALLITDLLA